jgi:hemolysin activation/secretion protein
MNRSSRRSDLFVIVGCLLAPPVLAQDISGLATNELQRQQQREQVQRRQDEAVPDVRLQAVPPAIEGSYPDETPCFVIRTIKLDGEQARRFQWALDAATPGLGRCLGSKGVNTLVAAVQNALVERGYVTSRVLAAPQDLRSGELRLVLVLGRIHAIRFDGTAPRGGYASALPAREGDVLNLRPIEQGIENFKRVPGTDADIQIVPGEQPGESDLVIKWGGSRGYRIGLSTDDSGSRATGTYQGGTTLSFDNPVGLQDMFYATLNHSLPVERRESVHGTHGYALHYSVPYGYWMTTLQVNDYRYHQTVAGANQDYIYSGTSTNSEAKLARLVYRDAVRKTTLAVRAYQRLSRNFIDDTEVEVQRRRMGGFALEIAHREFIGSATLDANLTWKRGTSDFGTLPAPEEAYGEGTSRPRLLNLDVNFSMPLTRALNYQAAWRGQWNRSPLIAQDRFAIGGRYTVRGFDGEASLSAERGWLLRNDVAWTLGSVGQVYAAFDYGNVSGPTALRLLGTSLGGVALGWRGQLGHVQLDLFAGAPMHKPAGFQTARVTTGFNLNYEY